MVSYHEHNEVSRTPEILARLQAGASVALVSDAGTPLLSDPGYRLVKAAIEVEIDVVPIPGPSAALAALAGSGLPTDSFRFCGFLPPRQGARRKLLTELRAEGCTLIFYEAPHRIVETLADIAEVLGNRSVVLARELTKLHEEFLRGTAASLRQELESRPSVKGELTLLVGKREGAEEDPDVEPAEEVHALEAAGLSRMEAVKQVAKNRGIPKRELYQRVIKS